MSSTNPESAALPPPAAWRNWCHSIGVHLTLLGALSSTLVLATTATVLYRVASHGFLQDDAAYLGEEAGEIAEYLREGDQAEALLRREIAVEGVASAGAGRRTYARVLRGGQPWVESDGIAQALPPALFPPPVPLTRLARHATRTCYGSACYQVACVRLDGLPDGPAVIQVAVDVSHELRLLRLYRLNLAWVTALAALVSTFLAHAIARRGLRPLRDMTARVQRVTASSLDECLEPRKWPAELAAMAGAFDAMLSRLHDSFGRLSRFSANLAHELRTPLNNLMGEAEVALAKDRPAAEYRQVIESAVEEYRRLAQVLESLFFIARAGDPSIHIERQAMDVRAEADAVAGYLSALAESRGVRLTCEGAARACANAALLQRALGNLVHNAVRHTPAGGEVRIRLSEEPGIGARIVVSDNGSGIPADRLARIVERSRRGEPSGESTHESGLGLGLAIVNWIAKVHGGSLRIDSTPGKGTTVTMDIPLLTKA